MKFPRGAGLYRIVFDDLRIAFWGELPALEFFERETRDMAVALFTAEEENRKESQGVQKSWKVDDIRLRGVGQDRIMLAIGRGGPLDSKLIMKNFSVTTRMEKGPAVAFQKTAGQLSEYLVAGRYVTYSMGSAGNSPQILLSISNELSAVDKIFYVKTRHTTQVNGQEFTLVTYTEKEKTKKGKEDLSVKDFWGEAVGEINIDEEFRVWF